MAARYLSGQALDPFFDAGLALPCKQAVCLQRLRFMASVPEVLAFEADQAARVSPKHSGYRYSRPVARFTLRALPV